MCSCPFLLTQVVRLGRKESENEQGRNSGRPCEEKRHIGGGDLVETSSCPLIFSIVDGVCHGKDCSSRGASYSSAVGWCLFSAIERLVYRSRFQSCISCWS